MALKKTMDMYQFIGVFFLLVFVFLRSILIDFLSFLFLSVIYFFSSILPFWTEVKMFIMAQRQSVA